MTRPSATHAGIAPLAGATEAFTRYQVPVGWVKRGMYVSALDRPWLDTPFMMQGFVVDKPEEMGALHQYCQFVIVEYERSRPEIREVILTCGRKVERDPVADVEVGSNGSPISAKATDAPSAEFVARPRFAPVAARASGASPVVKPGAGSAQPRVSVAAHPRGTPAHGRAIGRAPAPAAKGGAPRQARGRRGRLFGGLLAWLDGLLPGGARKRADEDEPIGRGIPDELADELNAVLGPGESLREWPERRSFEEELPRAEIAFARGDAVVSAIFADVANGRIPQVQDVRDVVAHVVDSMVDNPDALLWIAHLREQHRSGYRHALRVAMYMVALGRQLGFPKAQLAHMGTIGLLADVGMTLVPAEVRDKPGLLDAQEYALVMQHVRHSIDLLSKAHRLPVEVVQGISQHHERLDGSGYPHGLAGHQISVYGRMAAIADCYAALTVRRPYADPVSGHAALMKLFEWSDTLYHGPLIEQFVQAIGVFPVGGLVELSSGEVAIVLAHNRVRRLEPRVLILSDPDKVLLTTPRSRDLLFQNQTSGSGPTRIVRTLAPGAYGVNPADYYAYAEAGEPISD